MVLDVYISVTIPLLLFFGLECQRLCNRLLWNVLVGWLADCVLNLQHVKHCGFGYYQAPYLSLRKLEMRTQTVITKLVSLTQLLSWV